MFVIVCCLVDCQTAETNYARPLPGSGQTFMFVVVRCASCCFNACRLMCCRLNCLVVFTCMFVVVRCLCYLSV